MVIYQLRFQNVQQNDYTPWNMFFLLIWTHTCLSGHDNLAHMSEDCSTQPISLQDDFDINQVQLIAWSMMFTNYVWLFRDMLLVTSMFCFVNFYGALYFLNVGNTWFLTLISFKFVMIWMSRLIDEDISEGTGENLVNEVLIEMISMSVLKNLLKSCNLSILFFGIDFWVLFKKINKWVSYFFG